MESTPKTAMRGNSEVHCWTYHQTLFYPGKFGERASVYWEVEYDPGSDPEIRMAQKLALFHRRHCHVQ